MASLAQSQEILTRLQKRTDVSSPCPAHLDALAKFSIPLVPSRIFMATE